MSTFTDCELFTKENNNLFAFFTLLTICSVSGVAYSPENPSTGLELLDGNYYIRVRKECQEEMKKGDMWVQEQESVNEKTKREEG